jgi:hypothetical protein
MMSRDAHQLNECLSLNKSGSNLIYRPATIELKAGRY